MFFFCFLFFLSFSKAKMVYTSKFDCIFGVSLKCLVRLKYACRTKESYTYYVMLLKRNRGDHISLALRPIHKV